MNKNKRLFYKALLAIGLPVAIQNLISSSLNLVDTIMIGNVGEKEIAAVGMANELFFLFVLLIFGINSGISVLVAQFWGKQDVENVRKSFGLSLTSGLGIGMIFFIIGFFFPKPFLSLLVNDQEVISIGASYMKIVSFSYLFTAVTFSVSVTSRSIEQAFIPMIVSGISLVLNTILNWILIFGHFGFPEMGVQGAAIATLIARVVEFALLAGLIYSRGSILVAKFNELLSFNKAFVKKVFAIALPVIINEGFWALGTVAYSAAIGRINADAVAAFFIAKSIFRFFEVAYIGLASACGVMIGKEIGAGNEDVAESYAFRFVKIALALSVVIGLIMFVSSPSLLKFFKVPNSVRWDAIYILWIYAGFGIVKVFNLLMIVGVLRSGGDTKFSMLLEVAGVWGIGVPMAFFTVLVLKMPVYLVVFFICFEEVFKSVFGLARLKSGKWINNVIEEIC